MSIGEITRRALKELGTDFMDFLSVFNTKEPKEPKRARTIKGEFKADDKKTKNTNEAWVGGKAPKKKRKKVKK